ncbi:hypothetical protein JK636_22920 [Clostridium sp. YIM B02515]|uniref:Uncharacterized protein n=2 Tax=Clostridium rhizosphaerae TaxID=2803861 RepID=A0ABS1TH44_9CLOT|nr:hypothetical protein [Clostridium rhizosphaerae]
MRNGYPTAVVITEERDRYMQALEQASTEGKLVDFINIIEEAVDISLDMYLYMVK